MLSYNTNILINVINTAVVYTYTMKLVIISYGVSTRTLFTIFILLDQRLLYKIRYKTYRLSTISHNS